VGFVHHTWRSWTCESSPRSGSRNAWTRNQNVNRAGRLRIIWIFFFCQRDPNDFLLRLVSMVKNLLYHYDPETKQQSMEWGHSGSRRPKYSECKNSVERYSPWSFEIKMASSWLIIFQRAKLSTRSITPLCWCNWMTLWRKNVAGISPRWTYSCTIKPRLTGHLQSRNVRKSTRYVTCMAGCDNVLMAGW